MSFVRYNTEDSVISAETVVRPMWTGDQSYLSNFFTASTKMKLIDTLIPIAVNENKIFNVLVFSCAVRYLDEPPSPPPFQPPIPGVPQPPIAPPPLLPGMPPPKERVLQRKSGYTQPHFAALI